MELTQALEEIKALGDPRALGPVHIDYGETSCKAPIALDLLLR
jgi:hypothetical protein